MHLSRAMSRRSHRSLRLGAIALLAAAAIWPRAKAGSSAASTAELGGHRERAHATAGVAARAETTAAKLVSPPRTAKLTVAEADESQLNN
ncbi:MAG: hypothetical protein JWP87_960 [Labilithrix sp.]|jgi:hypothetical protein|nr:hypothetical protein [Labilithrix sp.]